MVNTLKHILTAIIISTIILCGCANSRANNGNSPTNAESKATIALMQQTPDGADAENASYNPPTSPIPDVSGRENGVEVSIFKDNTFDCDYADYEEIAYNFHELRRSVMAPKGWEGFRFYEEDVTYFENRLTGIPIYSGELPVEIDTFDYTTQFANDPMAKSIFFFAEYPWMGDPFVLINSSSNDNINKYDHETYIDKKGRSMQVYFLDGLPKYAVYDDFFNLCIWFNLESPEQIPTVVNMINSIEVTLSRDSEHVLYLAEKLGYTIIPPQ